jgi:hypothetical protein
MRRAHAIVVFFLIASVCLAADKKEEERIKPAYSIQELQQQGEKILRDTHTPGVSIVHKNGTGWVTGLGIADVASKRPVTADTCSASVRPRRLSPRCRSCC